MSSCNSILHVLTKRIFLSVCLICSQGFTIRNTRVHHMSERANENTVEHHWTFCRRARKVDWKMDWVAVGGFVIICWCFAWSVFVFLGFLCLVEVKNKVPELCVFFQLNWFVKNLNQRASGPFWDELKCRLERWASSPSTIWNVLVVFWEPI